MNASRKRNPKRCHLPVPPRAPRIIRRQANRFVGTVHRDGREYLFRVDRALADFILARYRVVSTLVFLRKCAACGPRLKSEAVRRGQPVPDIHLPQSARPTSPHQLRPTPTQIGLIKTVIGPYD